MNQGPPGDLYVQIDVREHHLFKRDDRNNLLCGVPISFTMAALGGEIEVPTLKGKVKITIPPETQTGKLFRLRGKGIQDIRGGAMGDMLYNVVVETPVNLNAEQKQLLAQLSSSLGQQHRKHSPKEQSWFETLKKFF